MLDLVVPCCPMLFHFGMSPRMAAYRVLRGVLPPWAWQSATCVLRAPSVINLEPLHVHHVELDTSLRPRDHRYVLAVQKAWSFSTRFLILLFVFFKLFVFICLHGVKSANGPNEKDFRTCYLASITPWLRPWESCFKKIPSCLFSRVYCPKASKSSIQWATRVLMPVCVSRLSFFLLSLMSDRSGLGPGKYTDQLQSTACSNCPIGSYADTWLGRIFTQTSLQLFTHFCTFANTKNLLDSDFSANPKGFRLWDCFVARGQAYRNATLVLQAVRPFLRQGTKDFELFALNLDTETIGTW